MKIKATTCSYCCICPNDGCDQIIEFTNIIVKDVLITGLADDDMRKEVLGWGSLDEKEINETIGSIVAKEMARAVNDSISS